MFALPAPPSGVQRERSSTKRMALIGGPEVGVVNRRHNAAYALCAAAWRVLQTDRCSSVLSQLCLLL